MAQYLDSARLLGQRTAELHGALGAETPYPAFAPEPVSPLYQRSLYQSMRNVQQRTMQELAHSFSSLTPEVQAVVQVCRNEEMLRRLRELVSRRLMAGAFAATGTWGWRTAVHRQDCHYRF
jgi:maltose alpha-D-glucosyltransferase/alpha-amylase